MLKTKHLIFIFIPAIIIGFLAVFIRVIQYEPLFPNLDKNSPNELSISVFDDDIITGYKKAAHTIVAFEDFNCEACQEQNFILEKFLEKYPKLTKVVWKGLPISKFPNPSEDSHKYAYCANDQNKFDEFKTLAFADANNLSIETLEKITEQIKLNKKRFETCLESNEVNTSLANNTQLGLLLNIQSVPTIFVNNKQITNPNSVEGWEEIFKNLNN